MRRIATATLAVLLAFSVLLMMGGIASATTGPPDGENFASSQQVDSNVDFSNDGTQTWAPGTVGLLGCLSDKTTAVSAPPFASAQSSSTVYATVSATVAPGRNGFFIYNFTTPTGLAPGTAATFNGDVGLIATGTMLRPEGYYQINTTPSTMYQFMTAGALSGSMGGLTVTSPGLAAATTNYANAIGASYSKLNSATFAGKFDNSSHGNTTSAATHTTDANDSSAAATFSAWISASQLGPILTE